MLFLFQVIYDILFQVFWLFFIILLGGYSFSGSCVITLLFQVFSGFFSGILGVLFQAWYSI